MKRILVVIAALFLSCQLKGQETNQLNDMVISSINKDNEWHDNFREERGMPKLQHRYVCSDGLPRDFPYDSLKNVTFFSIKFIETYSNPIRKKLKKGMGFSFVYYKLTNNTMRISITHASVKRKNSRRFFIGSSTDSNHYFYEYSCDKQSWELVKIKMGREEILLNP